MYKTSIKGVGHYVPERIVTNAELTEYMETTDEWIQERTGIKERRFVTRQKETSTTMGAKASLLALERANIDKENIDFIIFCTLSPDYYFPGNGVLLQRELGITKTEIGALDVRNQCSGFIYGLSVADQFIKSGMYKNILLVGAEIQSMALDFTTRGRGMSVIFGDGAGAVVLSRSDENDEGILVTKLHSDGTHAEELAMISYGCHGGYHDKETDFGYPEDKDKLQYYMMTPKMLESGLAFPNMNGKLVFKKAVVKFVEVINSALADTGLTKEDINLMIPHQANIRIAEFVQRSMKLRDDQVFNNIQKYGNTTAASIPIALSEAWEEGRLEKGDLLCLAAFGSGFTWGSALIRWA